MCFLSCFYVLTSNCCKSIPSIPFPSLWAMKKSIASNHPSRTIPSDIPILRKSPTGTQPKVPLHLQISPEAKELLELHLSVVGLDKYHYQHTSADQGQPDLTTVLFFSPALIDPTAHRPRLSIHNWRCCPSYPWRDVMWCPLEIGYCTQQSGRSESKGWQDT